MGVISQTNLNNLSERMIDLWGWELDADDDYQVSGQPDCLVFWTTSLNLAFAAMHELTAILDSETVAAMIGVMESEGTFAIYFPGFTIEDI